MAITKGPLDAKHRVGCPLTVLVMIMVVLFMLPPLHAIATDVPLQSRGGVYTVPVAINGVLTLNFIIDSGASEVQIPADVVLTLVRTQTILPSDFLPGREYKLADGSVVNSPRFVIRELRIADHRFAAVAASISPIEGEPLLGQSLLERFPHWTVDNRRHVLVLGDEEADPTARPGGASAPDHAPSPEERSTTSSASTDGEISVPKDWQPSVVRGPTMPTLRVGAALGTEFREATPLGLQKLSRMITLGTNDIQPGVDAELQRIATQLRDLPRSPRVKSDRGRLLNDAGLEAVRRNAFHEAAERFAEAFREDPGDVEVANNLGFALLSTQNFDEAEQYLLLTLLLAPTRSLAWESLARLYALRGAEQPAFGCFLNAYRFSRNQAATRKFLERLTESNPDETVRMTAARALRSPMLSAGAEADN